jgi:hypothetical protein
MFHGIRHIDLRAIDPGVAKSPIQKASSRADERVSCGVLFITGLFSHQHEPRGGRAFSENRLCRGAI